jgi:hypothetical protein
MLEMLQPWRWTLGKRVADLGRVQCCGAQVHHAGSHVHLAVAQLRTLSAPYGSTRLPAPTLALLPVIESGLLCECLPSVMPAACASWSGSAQLHFTLAWCAGNRSFSASAHHNFCTHALLQGAQAG